MMLDNFPKKYDPSFEKDLYEWWTKEGYFKPLSDTDPKTAEKRDNFVISLPPPNVTGVLHMGHAIMLAVEDTMVRFHRMQGNNTLRVPGTDHASISTQVVVERKLAEQGLSKESLGREHFLKKVRERVDYSSSTIREQTKSIGASVDWSREQFTMSEKLSRSVRCAFKKLYDEGKIYRSTYMVNWSPGAQTVLSDLEVDYKEEETKMYYIRYFVQGKGDSLTVATIRPETIFADVAVAVHPKDRRYKKWIGRNVLIPIVNRPIPVIADEEVQLEFGTGVLKITPAHAEADFEIGQRHELPMDRFAIDKDNIFTSWAGEEFEGKHCYEFMGNLIQYLDEIGNLERVEDYTTQIPYCDRTGARVQPRLSKQWFMDVKESAKRLETILEEKQVQVHPDRFVKIFQNWLGEIRPRCISRQLLWGHRIPVRYNDEGEELVFDDSNVIDTSTGEFSILSMIIFNLIADSRLHNPFNIEQLIGLLLEKSFLDNEGYIYETYCSTYEVRFAKDKKLLKEVHRLRTVLDSIKAEKTTSMVRTGAKILDILEQSCNITQLNDRYRFDYMKDGKVLDIHQETDVLDTWFSSGLRPFAILGWPEKTEDLELFYPNTVLETGYDIIFFRVIRMMLMGDLVMNEMPFKHVYLHGLVRDETGKKMSKSIGNVIDPLKMIDKYGADALRGALLQGNTPGNDQKFSEQKVSYMSRFINKFWNACRYVVSNVQKATGTLDFAYDDLVASIQQHVDDLNEYDVWMLSKVQDAIGKTTRYQQKFMLGDALQETIHVVWHDFCDWYIEIGKLETSKHTHDVMMYCLAVFCKLLHPTLPFVTEKLWSLLGFSGTLMNSAWPEEIDFGRKNYRVNLLMDMISQWRMLKQQVVAKPHEKVDVFVQGNKDIHLLVQDHEKLVRQIVNIETLTYYDEPDDTPVEYSIAMLMDIKLGAKGIKEVNRKSRLSDLEKQISEEEQFLQRLRMTLASGDFADKAPKKVVDEKRKKMEEVKSKIAKMQYEVNKIRMERK